MVSAEKFTPLQGMDPAEAAKLANEHMRAGLAERLGIEWLEISSERVVARMPVEGNVQPYGILHGGATFALLARVHRWTTYPITALIVGHMLIASGVLPGYRRVWRSMHLGGRVDADVAQRLWPAWLSVRDPADSDS